MILFASYNLYDVWIAECNPSKWNSQFNDDAYKCEI